jgi:putative SOS response-associated peptidase YedK
MCTNFVPSVRQEIAEMAPGLVLPAQSWPAETYPGYAAPILTRGVGSALQCTLARFGLMPHWCRDAAQAEGMARKTYNARSETAAEKPSYRNPWHQRQWAVVPMQSYFEPCWEDAHLHGGRAVRWQMALADGQPFGAAGLWDAWVNPQDGEVLHSFTLLTVNADGHAVMGRMHKPGEEKRMPVLLAPAQFAGWLLATPANAASWMQAWPAHDMVAAPAPRAVSTQPELRNLSLF